MCLDPIQLITICPLLERPLNLKGVAKTGPLPTTEWPEAPVPTLTVKLLYLVEPYEK